MEKNDKTSNNNLELFPVFVVHTFLNPVAEVVCVIWSLMFNIYTLSYYGTVVIVVVWWLDSQLPVISVPITT